MKRREYCFYQEKQVPFYDCDSQKRMRLESVLRDIADVAGLAYTDRGYSHSWLLEREFVFLLSRVSVHINRIPLSGEKILLETWEREIKGVVFYRDVVFYDEEGNALIEAASAWVLVNPKTRKILKPAALPVPFWGREEKAGCQPPARVKCPGTPIQAGRRRIVYSDIDANNHVYNAVYGGIACDFIAQEMIERRLVDFQIGFKHETVLGQELTIKRFLDGDMAYVFGELDGISSFETAFQFEGE